MSQVAIQLLGREDEIQASSNFSFIKFFKTSELLPYIGMQESLSSEANESLDQTLSARLARLVTLASTNEVPRALLLQCEPPEASETSEAVIRLQMAGGEFCGNAARSVAALVVNDFLNGRDFSPIAKWELVQREGDTFKFPIEVSGTSKILHAEVTLINGHFATKVTMPIRPEFSNVLQQVISVDGTSVPVVVVTMDGIIHILVKQEELAFTKENRKYQATLSKIVSALGLSREAAV